MFKRLGRHKLNNELEEVLVRHAQEKSGVISPAKRTLGSYPSDTPNPGPSTLPAVLPEFSPDQSNDKSLFCSEAAFLDISNAIGDPNPRPEST